MFGCDGKTALPTACLKIESVDVRCFRRQVICSNIQKLPTGQTRQRLSETAKLLPTRRSS